MATTNHKRLRVFAGPNGSGKSTITGIVMDHVHLGEYVNADELKVILSRDRQLDFSAYHVNLDQQQFVELFRQSSLATRVPNIEHTLSNVIFNNNLLRLRDNYEVEDYFVSYITSYIWNKLLETSNKFTIETVMSHPSKLDFMCLKNSRQCLFV